jgi:hypothetical protein
VSDTRPFPLASWYTHSSRLNRLRRGEVIITPMSPAEQVGRLREQIERANTAYYVLDAPEISDAEYDRLFRELQALQARPSRAAESRHPHPAGRGRRRQLAGQVHPPPSHARIGQRVHRRGASPLGRTEREAGRNGAGVSLPTKTASIVDAARLLDKG